LIKFFSEYKTEKEKSQFLGFVLALPLLIIIPIFVISILGYDSIASFFSRKNDIVYDYVWQIPIIALCMGYFEIFYAWVKVHLQSVYGNFIKEIGLRILISIFLFGVYFHVITVEQFITATMFAYLISMLLMLFYANKVQPISFTFKIPNNAKAILVYSSFIILSGSVANMLLDIDKTMLNQYIEIEKIAYFIVAGFIATVIAVPSRAMHQITYPITAKLMIENKYDELNDLYKKSSITLQIVGGLVYVGILVNINQIYLLLPKSYSEGIFVVFIIGLSKYFDLILGNNNAIIFNSKYYRAVLFLGLLLGFFAITLNMILIPLYYIKGAAIATLISITLYSIAKLLFVVLKMKLYPFTFKNIYSLAIGLFCFFAFYYWDFPFHPVINIVLKSILVTLFYVFLTYKANLSEDINGVISKFLKV
jgi:O-antigen/teichoic acid export membrane protein